MIKERRKKLIWIIVLLVLIVGFYYALQYVKANLLTENVYNIVNLEVTVDYDDDLDYSNVSIEITFAEFVRLNSVEVELFDENENYLDTVTFNCYEITSVNYFYDTEYFVDGKVSAYNLLEVDCYNTAWLWQRIFTYVVWGILEIIFIIYFFKMFCIHSKVGYYENMQIVAYAGLKKCYLKINGVIVDKAYHNNDIEHFQLAGIINDDIKVDVDIYKGNKIVLVVDGCIADN